VSGLLDHPVYFDSLLRFFRKFFRKAFWSILSQVMVRFHGDRFTTCNASRVTCDCIIKGLIGVSLLGFNSRMFDYNPIVSLPDDDYVVHVRKTMKFIGS
jgi:hypothetical protein